MPIGEPDRGRPTATPLNVDYRVGRIAQHLSGTWLDYGCGDGGYAEEILRLGADAVVGVDVEASRVEAARRRNINGATFKAFDGATIPLADASVDGAFVNEVMEHVADEKVTLAELFRVIRPGGRLIVISPNRWFPFEGHRVRIGRHLTDNPVPVIPWLPERLTRSWTDARNYWPHQLIGLVKASGFAILETGFIWPVFETYPWAPKSIVEPYQRHITKVDRLPAVRRLGVSTLVVGIRPS
jgi:SAM-dependent methyltransferase